MLKGNIISWAKKHLSWTAVIIIFGGLIFNCFVVIFAQGFNLFLSPQLLSFEFKIYLSLAVVFITFGSIIGIVWLIKNKHRHWAFILFFIPYGLFSILILPMLIPGFLFDRYLYYEGPSFLAIMFAISWIPAGLWLIGLIVILLLKNKDAGELLSSIDPLLEAQNENKVHRQTTPGQVLNSKLIQVSVLLLLLATVVSASSCVRMNTGYQIVTVKNYSSSGDQNLHHSQFSFECPKSYYRLPGVDLILYPGNETIFSRDRIHWFSIESSYIQINISPYSQIKEENPVSSSLIEQCIYFYCQSLYGRIPIGDYIRIKDLKISYTTVDGIIADHAVYYFDYSKPYIADSVLYDKVELVCFEREGIIWTIQMRADRADSISYSDFDHVIKSFKITP